MTPRKTLRACQPSSPGKEKATGNFEKGDSHYPGDEELRAVDAPERSRGAIQVVVYDRETLDSRRPDRTCGCHPASSYYADTAMAQIEGRTRVTYVRCVMRMFVSASTKQIASRMLPFWNRSVF
jgi:hypothetical protein